jgi:hypothetical protein
MGGAELRATQTLANDAPVKAADWRKITKGFSRFVEAHIRVADPVEA